MPMVIGTTARHQGASGSVVLHSDYLFYFNGRYVQEIPNFQEKALTFFSETMIVRIRN